MICPGWMKDRLIGWMLLIILRSSVVCHSSWKISGQDWCSLDSGESILSDQYGIKHSVYVSLTRDGSVWIRFGTDHASSEWNLENEARFPTQLSVLEKIVVNVLETINYTDSWCALTDLDLRLRADSGWHPSYMTVFDPKEKQIKTIVYRHHRDCQMSTNISLSPDKQGIVCEGGRKSACSQRNLPERGHQSSTLFLLNVNFDPNGPGHWECSDDELQNSYTFKGSYYYAYVKMAPCDTPSESRYLGHEATMRPNKDESLSNLIFLPDPLHGAISDGVIGGWRVFISIQSVRHEIYFQIWRPSVDQENTYSLVGQTFFKPTELRYTEINLDPSQFIPIRKGDLLGLYFPDSNPVGWSSVPCAFKDQLPKFHAKPDRVSIGQTFNFDTLPQSAEPVCRQYSFSAVFANRSTAKQIEDWVCPTAGAGPLFGSHRRTNPKDDSLIQEDAIHGKNPPPRIVAPNNDKRQPPGRRSSPVNGEMDDEGSPLRLLLGVIAGLMLMLAAVGLASYCRAVRS